MKIIAVMLSAFFLVISCAWCASAAWEQTEADYAAAKMQADSIPAAPLPEITEENIMFIVWLVVAIAAICIIAKLIQGGHLIPLVVLLLMLFMIGYFVASDKTGDGISDNQIISVVQPSGDNPESDLVYADVNKENATANVINAASFVVYVAAFIIGAIGIGFLFVMKAK